MRLEQCENCRGIFLDHGELEQILQAEQRYYGGGAAHLGSHGGHQATGTHPGPTGTPPGAYRDSPRPHRGEQHGHHQDSPRPYGHQRRGSFLGDLFG